MQIMAKYHHTHKKMKCYDLLKFHSSEVKAGSNVANYYVINFIYFCYLFFKIKMHLSQKIELFILHYKLYLTFKSMFIAEEIQNE